MTKCRLVGYDNGYSLSKRSLAKLEGVHPDLVMLVRLAIKICEVDFSVVDGVRTVEKQREYFDSGASLTMDSKHLTGHAVDLVPWVDGRSYFGRGHLALIHIAMKRAGSLLGIDFEWGGSWKTFKDGPHYQINLNS